MLINHNAIDTLDCEEAIAGFLCEAKSLGGTAFYLDCIAVAAKARAVNQLAKETGVCRKALCEMFSAIGPDEMPKMSNEDVSRLAKAFAPAYA